jgi:hypothetical protein
MSATAKKPRCKCGAIADRRCSFALSGKLEGADCGEPLCSGCAVPCDADALCAAHARMCKLETVRPIKPPGVRP